MTLEDVKQLITAGFTAEEIRGLGGFSDGFNTQTAGAAAAPGSSLPAPAPDTAGAEEAPAAPAGEGAEEKKEETKPEYIIQIENSINQLFKSVNDLSKAFAMPSISDVKPESVDDVVIKFFKEN